MNKQQELLNQKRIGKLALNDYSRERYQAALHATGHIVSWKHSKAQLYKMVLASKAAQDWLIATKGW